MNLEDSDTLKRIAIALERIASALCDEDEKSFTVHDCLSDMAQALVNIDEKGVNVFPQSD